MHSFSTGELMSLGMTGLGILLGSMVGWLGYRTRSLTKDGAAAAALIGALIFSFGGLPPSLVVIAFFISSNLITRYQAQQKEHRQLGFEKGGQRDAGQVLANGLVATLLVVLYGWYESQAALGGFVGAIAVATADTWGTEIGVLSQQQPRNMLSGQRVPRGTSGAVTALGNFASAVGALAIGALASSFFRDWRLLLLGLVGGVMGAMSDSLLGASYQALYYCPSCKVATESHPEHYCGSGTEHHRGWRWLHNDLVNFIATALGAGVSVGLSLLWA